MGKYFGTDGFRGEANVDLTADHAYNIGLILGTIARESIDKPSIVIGRDTRHSGTMFEAALAAGITAVGADAHLLGVITTPGVAYVTRTSDYAFGVMISASHNPFYDNGIKVLNANGEKLEDAVTERIEAFLDGEPARVAFAERYAIGETIDASAQGAAYEEFLISLAKKRFDGYRVALDCANGSAYAAAPDIYKRLGADVFAMSTQPDGFNINVNCGSTHIEALQAFVKENGCDLGFAFDGDADRCLAVDGAGNVVDGDHIMYLCGAYLKDAGRLANNTVVTTIMSNFGLYKALDAAGIAYEKTAVGDRFVYESMAANGHAIGGEQSGHIIFREFATTGDGMMTSLMVMEALLASGKTLAELAAPMTSYPQVLKNVRVADKAAAIDDEAVQQAIAVAGETLGEDGRVLVRQSGTEPVIRVMAEAADEQTCERHVDDIIDVLVARGHVVE